MFYQNYKDHENIVKLYSFFMAGRKAYMVMELLQGREVFDLICDDNHFEVLTESVLKSGSQTTNFGIDLLVWFLANRFYTQVCSIAFRNFNLSRFWSYLERKTHQEFSVYKLLLSPVLCLCFQYNKVVSTKKFYRLHF